MKKWERIRQLESQVEYLKSQRRTEELLGEAMLQEDCDFLVKEIENLIIYGMEKGYIRSYDIQLHPFYTLKKPVEVKGQQVNTDT